MMKKKAEHKFMETKQAPGTIFGGALAFQKEGALKLKIKCGLSIQNVAIK